MKRQESIGLSVIIGIGPEIQEEATFGRNNPQW